MTVKELSNLSRTVLEVKSGYNGKLLCKRYNGKKHADISEREVTAIWSEIRATNSGGYSSYAAPVLCAYVYGEKECAEQEAADEG
jgi:hypothetical protein